MENVKKLLRKTGWISILESLIFAILGIILVYKPEETVKVISIILGSLFIIVGIAKIISYFMAKGESNFYNYNLIYGIMAIIIGIIVMAYINTIGSIFRIIIGIWIIYTSLIRVSSSIRMRKIESKIWIFSLILAILMFACGVYTIVNSGVIVVTIGTIMIIYSVIDIIENIIFMKNIKEIL